MRDPIEKDQSEQKNLGKIKHTRRRRRRSLESLTPSTVASEKDPSFYAGVCSIIEACGAHGVVEIHFGDVSIFRTVGDQFLVNTSRKLKKVGMGQDQETEVTQDPPAPDTQNQIMDDRLDNLDLEDPSLADKLARNQVEEGI